LTPRVLAPGVTRAPRSSAELFERVVSEVETAEEYELLISLLHRAGIDDSIIGRWMRNVELHVDISDIEVEPVREHEQPLVEEPPVAAPPARSRPAAVARGGGRKAA
jgi:hypothetical protein